MEVKYLSVAQAVEGLVGDAISAIAVSRYVVNIVFQSESVLSVNSTITICKTTAHETIYDVQNANGTIEFSQVLRFPCQSTYVSDESLELHLGNGSTIRITRSKGQGENGTLNSSNGYFIY